MEGDATINVYSVSLEEERVFYYFSVLIKSFTNPDRSHNPVQSTATMCIDVKTKRYMETHWHSLWAINTQIMWITPLTPLPSRDPRGRQSQHLHQQLRLHPGDDHGKKPLVPLPWQDWWSILLPIRGSGSELKTATALKLDEEHVSMFSRRYRAV